MIQLNIRGLDGRFGPSGDSFTGGDKPRPYFVLLLSDLRTAHGDGVTPASFRSFFVGAGLIPARKVVEIESGGSGCQPRSGSSCVRNGESVSSTLSP
jgi:hypothetical protein